MYDAVPALSGWDDRGRQLRGALEEWYEVIEGIRGIPVDRVEIPDSKFFGRFSPERAGTFGPRAFVRMMATAVASGIDSRAAGGAGDMAENIVPKSRSVRGSSPRSSAEIIVKFPWLAGFIDSEVLVLLRG